MFIAISVVDTFALISQFERALRTIVWHEHMIYWTVMGYVPMCKLLWWLMSTSQVCSSYFVLLFTLERFISVRFPLKRAVICTRRRITIAIFSILVFAGLLTSYEFYFRDTSKRGKYNEYAGPRT